MLTRIRSFVRFVLFILSCFFIMSFLIVFCLEKIRPDILKVNPWDVLEGIVTIPSYIFILLLVLLPSGYRYKLRLSIFQNSNYVREIIAASFFIIIIMSVVGFVAYNPTDNPTRSFWNDFNWGNYLSFIFWVAVISLYNLSLRLRGTSQ